MERRSVLSWAAALVMVCSALLASLGCAPRATAATPAPADPFAHWAAVIVAGDWRAAEGGATEGFDNARRDVAAAFERAGFRPGDVAELSVRPQRYPHEALDPSSVSAVAADLQRKAAVAKDGCLFYLTTHGNRFGTPVGVELMTPARAAEMLDAACGTRPTVVIISACFSGIFIPKLEGPNRMVLTAARPDRTSFGCGQDDRYPYFDACILKTLPSARDFLALADAARTCVAERERAEQLIPPSQPQLSVGAAIEPILKADAFLKPPPTASPGVGAKPARS